MKKTLACCYTRYSTDTQNQSSTIGQLKSITTYCERNNIELIATYIDEAQSGTSLERENFQRMMRDAPTALWDTIVVYNMSRLSRSVKDTLILKEEFARMGKKVLSVIENQEETPEGDFFNLITYGMNELYVKQLKRDSWRGLMTNAMECKALGGVPPVGYDYDKDNNYIINPKEAEAVRYIFDEVLKGKSYLEIIRELEVNGYTNKGKPFSKNLTDILRNEKYAGVYLWNRRENKHKVGTKTNRKLKPIEEIVRIEDGIPVIIDKETFYAVQRLLDSRQKDKSKRNRKSKYLLTGIIRCGKCGYAFCGGQNFAGRAKTYRPYYRCNGRGNNNKCSHQTINRNYLDSYIILLIDKVVLNNSNAEAYKEFIDRYYRIKNSIINAKLELIEQKRKKIKKESIEYASRLSYATDSAYVELTQLIGENIATRTILDAKYVELQKKINNTIILNKRKVTSKLVKLREVNNNENRKELVKHIIKKIIITRDAVDIYIDINNLLEIDSGDDQIELVLRESRNNIASAKCLERVDLTSGILERAIAESLNELELTISGEE